MHLVPAPEEILAGPGRRRTGDVRADQLIEAHCQAARIDVAALLDQRVGRAAAAARRVRHDDAGAARHTVQIGATNLARGSHTARLGRVNAQLGRVGGDHAGHGVAVAAGTVEGRVAVVSAVTGGGIDDRMDLPVRPGGESDRGQYGEHLRGRLGEARRVGTDAIVDDTDELRRHGISSIVDSLAVAVGVDSTAVHAEIIERADFQTFHRRPGLHGRSVLGVHLHHFEIFLDIQDLGDTRDLVQGLVIHPSQQAAVHAVIGHLDHTGSLRDPLLDGNGVDARDQGDLHEEVGVQRPLFVDQRSSSGLQLDLVRRLHGVDELHVLVLPERSHLARLDVDQDRRVRPVADDRLDLLADLSQHPVQRLGGDRFRLQHEVVHAGGQHPLGAGPGDFRLAESQVVREIAQHRLGVRRVDVGNVRAQQPLRIVGAAGRLERVPEDREALGTLGGRRKLEPARQHRVGVIEHLPDRIIASAFRGDRWSGCPEQHQWSGQHQTEAEGDQQTDALYP